MCDHFGISFPAVSLCESTQTDRRAIKQTSTAPTRHPPSSIYLTHDYVKQTPRVPSISNPHCNPILLTNSTHPIQTPTQQTMPHLPDLHFHLTTEPTSPRSPPPQSSISPSTHHPFASTNLATGFSSKTSRPTHNHQILIPTAIMPTATPSHRSNTATHILPSTPRL